MKKFVILDEEEIYLFKVIFLLILLVVSYNDV